MADPENVALAPRGLLLESLPLARLVPLVNAGVLTPPELDSIAIEQGPRAYQAVLEGSAGRKQVIRF